MESNQNAPLFQLNIDTETAYKLRSAASWAKVLAIVGIIIGILCIVLAFIIQNAANRGGISSFGIAQREASTGVTVLMVMTILFGAIFIISGIFAFMFGNKILTAIKASDQFLLSSGIGSIKNYFAFRTIILIIWLLLFLIWMLAAINSPSYSGRYN